MELNFDQKLISNLHKSICLYQKPLVKCIKKSVLFMSSNEKTTKTKVAECTGRWTKEECRHFQELIQEYGKDWKKIHLYLPQRSLAQIRSHGQKFFSKTGNNKLKELERKAKLLAAMQIFKNENMVEEFDRLRQELPSLPAEVPKIAVLQFQNSPQVKSEDIFEELPEVKQEHQVQARHKQTEDEQIASKTCQVHYPFQESSHESLAQMQFPLPIDMNDAMLNFNQGHFANFSPQQ